MSNHEPPVYADTSFLISCFVKDEHTQQARRTLANFKKPLVISPLCYLEYRTAIWQRVGRGQFERADAKRICDEFAILLQRRLLIDLGEDAHPSVWDKATSLTDAHTADFHLRSLDIWHVAYALTGQVRSFWSFDGRQRKLAHVVGMRLNDM